MKRVGIIFRKELKETLRDRRSLMLMVVIPLVVFPILMNVAATMAVRQKNRSMTRELKIGWVERGQGQELRQALAGMEHARLVPMDQEDAADIERRLRSEDLDFVLALANDFDAQEASEKAARLTLYLRENRDVSDARKRLDDTLAEYRKSRVNSRLARRDISSDLLDPLKVEERDFASLKEKIGEAVGGMIPYLFVLFCFLGAMYPAIDLGAGEKERGTMETLLVSPARRLDIVLGKFLVVLVAALVSPLISMGGLVFSLKGNPDIPEALLTGLMKMVDLKTMLMVLSLLVPLAVFFAAALLTISITAQSFKEAQSLMTPLNFVIILPVFLGLMPGIKFTVGTAMIPVLNISLATKELVSGHFPVLPLVLTYGTLVLLAGVGLAFCVRWFQREDVLFRGN